jgi:hypothetical protein
MPWGVAIPVCMERQAQAFDFVLQRGLACASNHKYVVYQEGTHVYSECLCYPVVRCISLPAIAVLPRVSRASVPMTHLQRYVVISHVMPHLLVSGCWNTDSAAECCLACAARYTSCGCNTRYAVHVAQPSHRYRQLHLSEVFGRLQGNGLNLTWPLTSQGHDSHWLCIEYVTSYV